MPWKVAKTGECPVSKPWGVIKEDDGEVEGCHETQAKAEAQQAALYASEDRATYTCECLDCGYTMDTDEHCADVACPECGGEMRRPDRPGAGRSTMSKFREFLDRLRGLLTEAEGEVEPGLPAGDRAVSLGQVAEQFWAHLGDTERYDAWPMDIYLDEGAVYMLVTERGKLYRVPVAVEGGELRAGDWLEVEIVHQPVGRTTWVTRQADGSYRWFSIAAAAVLNRVGEIDSTALFDAMVRRFKEAQAAGDPLPERDFFHLGAPSAFGDVDLLERDGWLLIASGTFYDTPLGNAMRRAIEAEPGVWGDSISYKPLAEPAMVEVAEGVRVPVYEDGVLRYISSVHEKRAASHFTTTTVQEVTRMRAEVLEALRGLTEHGLSEDEVDALVAQVDDTNRAIDGDPDLIRREAEDVDAEEAGADPVDEAEGDEDVEREGDDEAPAEDVPAAEETTELVLDDEALGAIVARVLESTAVAGLGERAGALEAEVQALRDEVATLRELNVKRAADTDKRLASLERTDAEKQREWVADLPARQTRQTRVSYRPREAKAADPDAPPSYADLAQQTLASVPELGSRK